MSRKAASTSTSSHRGTMAAISPPCDGFAIAYLNVVMEDADQDELIAALTRIARGCGGSRLVEKIELNAAALYRTLCLRGNPELKCAAVLLKAMGIRLALQPIRQS